MLCRHGNKQTSVLSNIEGLIKPSSGNMRVPNTRIERDENKDEFKVTSCLTF